MRYRILIVEGDPLVRRCLQDILEAAGLEACPATGEDAMELLERQRVHLVLTEQDRPQIGGSGLLWCIKTKYAEVPVVVMSTDEAFASAIEAMRLGAEDYLSKPFGMDTLLATINRVIVGGDC
jgi:DNA-binding NtrC family response regulator